MTLPFKPFAEMTPADYADIGLRCGLEVHQQLLTKRKLFCRCPAGRYSQDYQAEVLRHMRPTLSELGEYDGTALMEKKTKKNIFYRLHQDTVCTYEFDDTPPFLPDEQAIDIALEISLLLNLSMVGEMHIARKQYLDGSIPTGFQRTAILGVGGWIPYKDRRIGIRQLSLEEDACREVSDIGHDRICLTDRLGMPLIEAVTEPDMRTPQETAEVCQLIRLLCRGTGKVRTGYGAAREDVNVSVRGGTRVEVKGVPQITRIPLLVYNEAMRQCSLLHIRDLLKERGITADTLEWSSGDVTRALTKTQYSPIRKALARGHGVKFVLLKGWAGLLTEPTQEHTTFAKEFADRIRVIACLTKLPNMVHSDTASDLLTVRDWKELRKRAQAADTDALILVWGDEPDTETACQEIVNRAREATEGVPNDTRQAFKDGTNGFERVLPGAERMYPDTDLPPMVIEADRISAIRAALPQLPWVRTQRYDKLDLPADVREPLCICRHANLFDQLVDDVKTDPKFTAIVLIQWFKALRRDGLNPDNLTDDDIRTIFEAHAQHRLTREGLWDAFRRILNDRQASDAALTVETVLSETPSLIDAKQLDVDVGNIIERAQPRRSTDPDTQRRYLMGRLMHDLRGRADGRDVAASLARATDTMHKPQPARNTANE